MPGVLRKVLLRLISPSICLGPLRRFLVWIAVAGSCAFAGEALAQVSAPASSFARQAEAVDQVVLGILSYVRWPVEPTEVALCVVGPTEYSDGMLRGMVQATGRLVVAQRKAISDPGLGEQCHAVYLGAVSDAERQQIFRGLNGHAVLSISERDPECSVGSMFCLKVGAPRVTFEVNLDSIARSGMRVHPSVLRLGQRQAKP
jgi:hypothetical protein